MSTTADELNRLRNLIREKRKDKARSEGKKAELLKSLKKNFGLTSLKEAKKKLEQIEEKIDSETEAIRDGVMELKEIYDW